MEKCFLAKQLQLSPLLLKVDCSDSHFLVVFLFLRDFFLFLCFCFCFIMVGGGGGTGGGTNVCGVPYSHSYFLCLSVTVVWD